MKAIDTVIPAFTMAQKNRPVTQDLIFHSDQGIQYTCHEFRNLLKKNPMITRSMSRKGNCWDNAVAESFFKTLKAECIYQHKLADKEQAALVVFEYIEAWYKQTNDCSLTECPLYCCNSKIELLRRLANPTCVSCRPLQLERCLRIVLFIRIK